MSDELLLDELPDWNDSTDMDIEWPDLTELRYFYTYIQYVNKLNRDT